MQSVLRLACSPWIARGAVRIALVIGTLLNLINQGTAFLPGQNIDWFHLVLNYLVPYCFASYSAAKCETSGTQEGE